jgi:tetratricopeptide (TPR) repeat protein
VKKTKIIIFVLILALYGSFLIHRTQLQTDDLGRHLQNGKIILRGNFDVLKTNFYSYSEPNFPYINDHWLSSVIFYVLYGVIGFGGLTIFTAIVLLSVLSLLFWITLKRADFWLAAVLSLPAVLILAERIDVRPEMFSYLFAVVFLYFLLDLVEHPEHKRIFWLVPMQLLWVNMHTFFVVGVMLAGGFLLERIILDRKNLKNNLLIKKLSFLLAALIAVCFVTPNGVTGIIFPLSRFGGYSVYVDEGQSIFRLFSIKPVEDISAMIFIFSAFILAASFFFGFRKQKSFFYLLASIGTIAAGFGMIRLLPFFALIFLPAASLNFNDIYIKTRDRLKGKYPKITDISGKIFVPILAVVIVCLIFFRISGKILKYDEVGIGLTSRSESAALFFKEQKLAGPILNDPAIGGYLTWYFFPEEKVFFDNRHMNAYSAGFIKDTYSAMMTEEEKWKEMLKKYKFNTIFFYYNDGALDSRDFLYKRINDPDWALIYADNDAVILLRNLPENREKIKNFRITAENAGEKLNYMTESEDVRDWVAAGDIFNFLNRDDLAMSVLRKVILKQPGNFSVWRIMGEIAILRNNEKNNVLAKIYLKRSIDLGQKNEWSYTWLGLAYLRSGQFKESEENLKKALKINPNNADAEGYMNIVQERMKKKGDNNEF